jgi:hypothetical protein
VERATSRALARATRDMDKCIGEWNLERIAAMAVRYDQIRGRAQQAHAIIVPDDATAQMSPDALLGDLEPELEQEALAIAGMAMPSSPEPIRKPAASEAFA